MFPDGTLRGVMLHWTAGDYERVFSAYHFCLLGAADVRVAQTCDLRANMVDVRSATAPYAAHTAGRNSYTAGIAICAMESAQPSDFGRYPLTGAQIDAACIVAAALVKHYAIALSAVRTHAEAALEDGYFGAGGADLRWDIARLAPAGGPLQPAEAATTGDYLRARVAQRC